MKPSDVRPPKLNCQEKGDKSKLTPEVLRQSPGSKNDNKVVHESPKRKNPNVSKGADGTEAIIFVHKAAVSSCGGRRDLGESLGCGWGVAGVWGDRSLSCLQAVRTIGGVIPVSRCSAVRICYVKTFLGRIPKQSCRCKRSLGRAGGGKSVHGVGGQAWKQEHPGMCPRAPGCGSVRSHMKDGGGGMSETVSRL